MSVLNLIILLTLIRILLSSCSKFFLPLFARIEFLNFKYEESGEGINDRLREFNIIIVLFMFTINYAMRSLIFNFQGANSFLLFRPADFAADGCYARKVVTACLASATVGKRLWSIQMELKDDCHQFAFQPLV